MIEYECVSGVTMCGTCKSIDDEITRYYRLGKHISDPQTLNGIALLIEKLEGQKRHLHLGEYVCAGTKVANYILRAEDVDRDEPNALVDLS
jgi:hypothetical protein